MGGSTGLAPAAGWADGTGAVLGLSRRAVGYGFRHDPFNTKYTLTALYGPGNSRFGAYFDAEVRPENSVITYAVTARATRLASDRFPGFGNDTPLLDSETMLVRRDEYLVHPTIRLNVGSAHWFALGPVVRYIDADPQAGSPAALLLPDAQEPYGQVGGQFDLSFDGRDDPTYPTKGYTLRGAASFFPETWDVPTAYSSTHLQATAYLPLGGPVIALRWRRQGVWRCLSAPRWGAHWRHPVAPGLSRRALRWRRRGARLGGAPDPAGKDHAADARYDRCIRARRCRAALVPGRVAGWVAHRIRWRALVLHTWHRAQRRVCSGRTGTLLRQAGNAILRSDRVPVLSSMSLGRNAR